MTAIRRWLLAGLLVVVPVAITIWVLQWIIGTLDQTLQILPAAWHPDRLLGVHIPGFGVVLQAVASSGDANILSTPHIIAMDNVQAEINIGQNVPLQTSGIAPGALGGLGGLGGLAGLAGGAQGGALGGLGGLAGGLGGGFGVPRQDVGTIIRITPHINAANDV